jgi:hypothetical protein
MRVTALVAMAAAAAAVWPSRRTPSAEERPYIFWSAGLAEGANYDVKKFQVRVEYYNVR